MKIKILFTIVIFLFIGTSNLVQSQETQKSKKKKLTMQDIMNLKQYHVDGAITSKYTDVTVEEVRQQIDENVEKAARQFGFVGKAFNCGALDDLGKLYGNKDNRLNLEEVLSLKSVDVYRAVLLNINKRMSVDSINTLEDSEAIALGVQALGEKLSMVTDKRDPCGLDQYRTNVPLGDSPHVKINNTCRVFKFLLEALDNQYVNVRVEAIRSIGNLEPMSIIKPLITTLSDKSIDVRKEAVEILKKVTGEDFGMDSTAWLNWWENRNQ
ncbi:MAG: HEAT repeat domain-containing protein [Candidatus Aminicenantes bacterium]|nr:HEAT repeat domain-containing protein [Candidatus Aminicenantes bacterium]